MLQIDRPRGRQAARRLTVFLVTLLSGACGQGAEALDAESRKSGGTTVAVLGMIHGAHLESSRWGLDQVREAIRRIDPDVICAEIPPDRWPKIWRDYSERGVIEDSRVKRFPEYTEVLLPLKLEMGFVVEPCAAWTQEMADERKARLEALEVSTELRSLHERFEQREEEIAARLAEQPIVDDDPLLIHSPLYDERTREELAAYDELLNDYLGAGGWTNINRSHWALVEAAIARHPGKRILITFGAGHKYWFLDRLRERDDLRLLDLEEYLVDLGFDDDAGVSAGR